MLTQKISVLLTACILSACVTSPTGRNQFIMMPDTQIDSMGLQAFDKLKREKPISTNQQNIRLTQCVAQAITQEVGAGAWEVVVFKDKTPNAFALPGNKIGVHTGLLTLVNNNPAQLAAVIGHEVGHVLAKHSNERASQESMMNTGMSVVQAIGGAPTSQLGQLGYGLLGLGAQYGVLMPFSRTQESEADIIGVDLMAKAGFDPRESIGLWQRMEQASQGQQPAEYMSTHPSHATRIQDLERHMPQAMSYFQQAQAMGKHPYCS